MDHIEQNVFFNPIPDRNHLHLIWDRKTADSDFLQLGPTRSGKGRQIDIGQTSDTF